jgi:hypothetical protein
MSVVRQVIYVCCLHTPDLSSSNATSRSLSTDYWLLSLKLWHSAFEERRHALFLILGTECFHHGFKLKG